LAELKKQDDHIAAARQAIRQELKSAYLATQRDDIFVHLSKARLLGDKIIELHGTEAEVLDPATVGGLIGDIYAEQNNGLNPDQIVAITKDITSLGSKGLARHVFSACAEEDTKDKTGFISRLSSETGDGDSVGSHGKFATEELSDSGERGKGACGNLTE